MDREQGPGQHDELGNEVDQKSETFLLIQAPEFQTARGRARSYGPGSRCICRFVLILQATQVVNSRHRRKLHVSELPGCAGRGYKIQVCRFSGLGMPGGRGVHVNSSGHPFHPIADSRNRAALRPMNRASRSSPVIHGHDRAIDVFQAAFDEMGCFGVKPQAFPGAGSSKKPVGLKFLALRIQTGPMSMRLVGLSV